jgi:PAS domain-containing protein
MNHEMEHHEELIKGISRQMSEILDSSQEAVYIYLDDIHKVCNQKCASLLGYSSPREWAKIDKLMDLTVDPKSQETLATNYNRAMEKKVAANFGVIWKKKSGGTVNTIVTLVPIAFEDHLFALHFVS